MTREARQTAQRFVDQYHSYIKWANRPSRKLYWLLYQDTNIVGVWGLSSAFHRPQAVQDYMTTHHLTYNQVGNNIVYCLAGHTHRNTGSMFLARLRRDAQVWWSERYGDTLRAFQTFILPPRTGAVYRADNWTPIGMTSGSYVRAQTLQPDKVDQYPASRVERRVFKSGEVIYFYWHPVHTESKLILMRLA